MRSGSAPSLRVRIVHDRPALHQPPRARRRCNRRALAAVATAVSLVALSAIPVGPAGGAHASNGIQTDIDLADPTKPSEFGLLLPSTAIAPRDTSGRSAVVTSRYPQPCPGTAANERQSLTSSLPPTPRAFVVLHRDRVVTEWYDGETGRTTKLASWSLAKSMAGLLTGQAIDEGLLTLNTRVVTVLPWLRVERPADGDPPVQHDHRSPPARHDQRHRRRRGIW